MRYVEGLGKPSGTLIFERYCRFSIPGQKGERDITCRQQRGNWETSFTREIHIEQCAIQLFTIRERQPLILFPAVGSWQNRRIRANATA
jgi:hypothetical protein